MMVPDKASGVMNGARFKLVFQSCHHCTAPDMHPTAPVLVGCYISCSRSKNLRPDLLYFRDYGSADLPFLKSRKKNFPTFNSEAVFFSHRP
jgi:hypothetical protein